MSRIGQDSVLDVLVFPLQEYGVVSSDFSVVGDVEWDWHRHDADELLWGTRGSLIVDAEDGVRAVPWTVGLWIPAGRPHRVTAGSGTEFVCTYFAPRLGSPPRDGIGAVGVTPAVRALLRELSERDLDPETRELAERLALRLLKAESIVHLDLPLPDDDRARRVAESVLADPAEARTLQEWGAIVGASERNLSRIFRRETGMPFAQWRTRARLRLAVELLAAEHPVGSVAHRVGYATASAFVQVFRRELGMTPGAFAVGERRA